MRSYRFRHDALPKGQSSDLSLQITTAVTLIEICLYSMAHGFASKEIAVIWQAGILTGVPGLYRLEAVAPLGHN
jgi:hypothetical protein